MLNTILAEHFTNPTLTEKGLEIDNPEAFMVQIPTLDEKDIVEDEDGEDGDAFLFATLPYNMQSNTVDWYVQACPTYHAMAPATTNTCAHHRPVLRSSIDGVVGALMNAKAALLKCYRPGDIDLPEEERGTDGDKHYMGEFTKTDFKKALVKDGMAVCYLNPPSRQQSLVTRSPPCSGHTRVRQNNINNCCMCVCSPIRPCARGWLAKHSNNFADCQRSGSTGRDSIANAPQRTANSLRRKRISARSLMKRGWSGAAFFFRTTYTSCGVPTHTHTHNHYASFVIISRLTHSDR
jgi:hypothetical protein